MKLSSLTFEALQAASDAVAWAGGLLMHHGRQVLDCRAHAGGAGQWRLEGAVQSRLAQPYTVQVDLALAPSAQGLRWSGVCSCAVGRDCKHAVALVLAALQADEAPLAQTRSAVAGRPVPSAVPPSAEGAVETPAGRRQPFFPPARADAVDGTGGADGAEEAALHWLRAWEDLAVAEPDPGWLVSPRTDRPACYLYLVASVSAPGSQRPALQIEAVVSRAKPGGGWNRPQPITTPPGPGQAAYDAAPEADRELLQWLRAMSPPTAYYAARGTAPIAVLDGGLAPLLLQRAAATGRLFMDGGGRSVGAPLRWGAPLAVAWQWQAAAPAEVARRGGLFPPGPPFAPLYHPPVPAWRRAAQGGDERARARGGAGLEGGAGGVLRQSADSEEWWTVRPQLPLSTATLYGNRPPLYLDAARGVCGAVHAPGLTSAQWALALDAPAMGRAFLQQQYAALRAQWGEALPAPPLGGAAKTLTGLVPVPRLSIRPVPRGHVASQGLLSAHLQFDYGGVQGWWPVRADRVWVPAARQEREDGGVRLEVGEGGEGGEGGEMRPAVWLQRDLAAERAAVQHLLARGLVECLSNVDVDGPGGGAEGFGCGTFILPGDQPQHDWMRWVDADFAGFKRAGFAVGVDSALHGWIVPAGPVIARVQGAGVQSDATGSPWLSLSLGMDVNGVRHNILPWLPDMIAALGSAGPPTGGGDERGAGMDGEVLAAERAPASPEMLYLPLPDSGGFVRLTSDLVQAWLDALLDWVQTPSGEATHAADFARAEHLRVSRTDCLRLHADMGEQVVWEEGGDASLGALLGGTLPAVAPPTGLRASLRPYQQHGLNWLQCLRAQGLGGVLADEMGLGKTLQTLAHILLEKEAGRLTAPALVVAPVSVMGNWVREAERFCPSLRCALVHGAQGRDAALRWSDHDLVIAPYSVLLRDRARWLAQDWHLVVLDEAQQIKNASTQVAQVAVGLRAQQRLCLSGTPLENHLGEVWSLFHFLMPGWLGSAAHFQRHFRAPIEKRGDVRRMAQLRARLAPFLLRRSKAAVASELPAKTETVLPVPLSGAQADLYETIRLATEKTVLDALATQGLGAGHLGILDALLKLRQVCCHPPLVASPQAGAVVESAKLKQLMQMLPPMVAQGRRVLVFSQFTGMLSAIEAELAKTGLAWAKLTGRSQRRDAVIETFTSGRVPIFLISLKAGGVGLNLPQADTVIHYDPWWNPAVQAQASDRAHRIGQTQPVWVIKLVAQGTIEQRMLEMQARKAQLAEGLYAAASGRAQAGWTEGDLVEWLAPLSKK